MSDISFCSGLSGKHTCPIRRSCSRYMLSTRPQNHSMWQSHLTEAPFKYVEDKIECELYLKVNK